MEVGTGMVLVFMHGSIPDPPVSAAVPLSLVGATWVLDDARTTALASRWCRIWHSVPLALVDAYCLPNSGVSGEPRQKRPSRQWGHIERAQWNHKGVEEMGRNQIWEEGFTDRCRSRERLSRGCRGVRKKGRV